VPRPPAHLSKAAKRWFKFVAATYVLDATGALLLARACESLDLAEAARERIAQDGLTMRAGTGALKAHPLVAVVLRARGQFASMVEQLDLDDGVPAPAPEIWP
jgi:P27 family predicted phage terminase small subunit